jgi:hypothetical protein
VSNPDDLFDDPDDVEDDDGDDDGDDLRGFDVSEPDRDQPRYSISYSPGGGETLDEAFDQAGANNNGYGWQRLAELIKKRLPGGAGITLDAEADAFFAWSAKREPLEALARELARLVRSPGRIPRLLRD